MFCVNFPDLIFRYKKNYKHDIKKQFKRLKFHLTIDIERIWRKTIFYAEKNTKLKNDLGLRKKEINHVLNSEVVGFVGMLRNQMVG